MAQHDRPHRRVIGRCVQSVPQLRDKACRQSVAIVRRVQCEPGDRAIYVMVDESVGHCSVRPGQTQ